MRAAVRDARQGTNNHPRDHYYGARVLVDVPLIVNDITFSTN